MLVRSELIMKDDIREIETMITQSESGKRLQELLEVDESIITKTEIKIVVLETIKFLKEKGII